MAETVEIRVDSNMQEKPNDTLKSDKEGMEKTATQEKVEPKIVVEDEKDQK